MPIKVGIKKGKNMKNLNQREQEIARNFGTNLCGVLIEVVKKNINPLYKEQLSSGKVVPNKPFCLLTVKKTPITTVGVVETANGLRLEVNNNEKFRFKFEEPFAGATPENVSEAIRRFEDGRPPLLFVDYAGVLKQLKALNSETQDDLDKFATQMMSELQALQAVMKADEADLSQTYNINI